MKKNFMRLFSWALALMMVVGLLSTPVTARAEGDSHTITLTNAVNGKEYKGYKIFDAEGDDEIVNYTISTASHWYNKLKDAGLFTFEGEDGATVLKVGLADGMGAEAIAAWFKALPEADYPATPDLAATEAASNQVAWGSVAEGYYFITSTLGTVVAIDTNSKDVLIKDKTQTPGFTPDPDYDPEDPKASTGKGKFVKRTETLWGKSNSASVDDVVEFRVNAYVPLYDGEKEIKDYTFIDTLDDSLTLVNNSIRVELEGDELDITSADPECTVKIEGQKITISYAIEDIAAVDPYPADAKLQIYYNATLNSEAVYDNKNTVEMKWTTTDNGEGTDGESETDTYTYAFNLKKVDQDSQPLDDAEFSLSKADGSAVKFLYDADASVYTVSKADGASETITVGSAKIFGLKEGTYTLTETKAPKGYNILTETVSVTVGSSGSENGVLSTTVVVENRPGTLLPSTGGIGTTIFYIVGGILMIGAVLFLVTNKKMKDAE